MSTRNFRAPLSALLISVFLALAVSAPAQAGFPLILSATVDYTHNTMTITGKNFGSSPTIIVGSVTFPTPSSVSSNLIVGSFPSGMPASQFTPGTYFLTLQFTNQYPVVFWVDIDADGASSSRFVDNGDGTVTDNKTGLMWEKATTACGGEVTCVNNGYSWSSVVNGTTPDGTLYTDFLATLNGGDYYNPADRLDEILALGTCFANHCDWRIPTIAELRSIISAPYPTCTSSPCIDPIFGPTSTTNRYWSSGSLAADTRYAWNVEFGGGSTGYNGKSIASFLARAVRGGR